MTDPEQHSTQTELFLTISQEVEDALIKVAETMLSYRELFPEEGTEHKQFPHELSVKDRPLTPAIAAISYGHSSWQRRGIGGPFSSIHFARRSEPTSRHEEILREDRRAKITKATESLRAVLCKVPLIRHDALQIDISTVQMGPDKVDLFKVSIDGVPIYAGYAEIGALSRQFGAVIAELSLSSPRTGTPMRFYMVENYIVCAPGPGWAWLKLQVMISGKSGGAAISPTNMLPPIFQISSLDEIKADLFGEPQDDPAPATE